MNEKTTFEELIKGLSKKYLFEDFHQYWEDDEKEDGKEEKTDKTKIAVYKEDLEELLSVVIELADDKMLVNLVNDYAKKNNLTI